MKSKLTPTELSTKIETAKNPDTGAAELESLFGLSTKLDLILAGHANSPPERLRQLAVSGSDTVQRRLIWNPAMPAGEEYAHLVNMYPEVFIKKLPVIQMIEECSARLDGLTSIIELSSCPEELLTHLAKYGSVEQRELLYLTGREPWSAMTGITGESIYKRRLADALNAVAMMDFDGLTEDVRERIRNYLYVARPYATPTFITQDRSSREQRCGNLFGGYPYTSEAHPWPLTDGNGSPMQPVLQIKLSECELFLNETHGDGLLQVWGRTDENRDAFAHSARESWVLIRHIPDSDLQAQLNDDFPLFAPWESDDCGLENDAPYALFPDGPEEMKLGSAVKWKSAGAMWRYEGVLLVDGSNDELYLNECIFSRLSSSIFLPGNAPELYIGGFGGQAGGHQDPTIRERLIVRAKIGYGMHLGVFRLDSESKPPIFGAVVHYY